MIIVNIASFTNIGAHIDSYYENVPTGQQLPRVSRRMDLVHNLEQAMPFINTILFIKAVCFTSGRVIFI